MPNDTATRHVNCENKGMYKRLFALTALLAVFLTTPAWALPVSSSNNPPATARTTLTVPRGVSLGSRDEDHRYASQEAKSPDAKKYRGGDVIVISATALAIILLVVVILILI